MEHYIRGLFTIFIDTSELMHLGISFQLCLIHSPSYVNCFWDSQPEYVGEDGVDLVNSHPDHFKD